MYGAKEKKTRRDGVIESIPSMWCKQRKRSRLDFTKIGVLDDTVWYQKTPGEKAEESEENERNLVLVS